MARGDTALRRASEPGTLLDLLERLIELGGTPAERTAALGLATDALADLERFKGQGPLNARIAADALAILEAPPAAARVICGRALARVGDLRPGVCTLPPAMLELAGGRFVIGESPATSQYDDEINDQPLTLPPFALARYPLTNAQFKLFIDAQGYQPDQPWWDDPGRTWLRDPQRTKPRTWVGMMSDLANRAQTIRSSAYRGTKRSPFAAG